MAGPIAPWLIPTDVVGSMSRGAQLGLSARSQDEAEASAADRLRLAYDQMATEERRSSELQKYRMDQAAQSLLLKKQEHEMLNAYRQGELQTRAAAQALQAKHFDELKRHNMAMEGRARLHNVAGVGLVQEDADGNVDVVMPSGEKEPTAEQKARLALSAGTQLDKFATTPPTTPGGIQASNVAWNVLQKYGGVPPPGQTQPEEPGLSPMTTAVMGALTGLGGMGYAASKLLRGRPSEGTVPRGTNSPGNFKIKAIRQKEAPTVDEGMDDEEQ